MMKTDFSYVIAVAAMLALVGCTEPNDFPPRPTGTPTPASDVIVSTVAPGSGPATNSAPLPRPTTRATSTQDRGGTSSSGVTVSTVAPPAPVTQIVDGSGGGGVVSGTMVRPTEPPTEVVQDGSPDITMADNGHTITYRSGQTFLMKLNPDMAWSIQIEDPDVIVQVMTFAPIPGAQGMYEASKPGRTLLSATGTMVCPAGEACPALAMLFQVTIVVQ